MKMLITFLFISNLSCIALAQRAVQANNPPTRKPASDTALNQKLALAKEFVDQSGMKKEFDMAIGGGDHYLEKQAAGKDAPATAAQKKIAALAKTKWQTKKKNLFEAASTSLQKDLANNFTEPELKYLVELSKSSVYKKYRSFLESDSYTKFYSYPVLTARELLAEAKKEVALPAAATK